MKPRTVKWIVKLAIGLAGSTVLGFTYKGEKAIQSKIDDHFKPKPKETPE